MSQLTSSPNTPNPRKGTETGLLDLYLSFHQLSPNTPNPRKGTETYILFY